MNRAVFSKWSIVAALGAVVGAGACADSPTATRLSQTMRTSNASNARVVYEVSDLQSGLGSAGFADYFSLGFDVNNADRVAGGASTPDGSQHGFVWQHGAAVDVGTLGGANSQAGGRAGHDDIAVSAEIADVDPLSEDFCAFHSVLVCRAAVWRQGTLTQLPTLGGVNAVASEINGRGEVVGTSDESMTLDASCIAPQKVRFQGVMWDQSGRAHKLSPLPGDEVGFATRNNDTGQAVGSSGHCGNTSVSGLALGPHAVLWNNGSPTYLGSLVPNADVGVAADVNNRGEVIGGSGIRGQTIHAFLWTTASGMRDLGPGLQTGGRADAVNAPFEINNQGTLVGTSCHDITMTDCAAYVWQDGVMTDLNELVSPDSPLYLVLAFGINDQGDVTGLAVEKETGAPRAFLATPAHGALLLAKNASRAKVATPTAAVRVMRAKFGLPR